MIYSQVFSEQRYAHYRKGMRAVVELLQAQDYDPEDCLQGLGFKPDALESDELRLSLEQEYAFYRNILNLSDNLCVGLELGCAFPFETYGLLGYGILSSATLRDAIRIAQDFAPLTYSHFSIQLVDSAALGGVAFSPNGILPSDLLQIYSDRDIVAALTGLMSIASDKVQLKQVKLMHENVQSRGYYEDFFECEIQFGASRNELLIDRIFLDQLLPRRDREASNYCREQCQLLLDRLSMAEGMADKVRSLLVSEPGYFPSLEEVAEKLNIGLRTLRRSLKKEGTSFQTLLQEIRLELASEYLQSNMPIETIAVRLGYSEPANFSHAFKRWTGMCPREYKKSY